MSEKWVYLFSEVNDAEAYMGGLGRRSLFIGWQGCLTLGDMTRAGRAGASVPDRDYGSL